MRSGKDRLYVGLYARGGQPKLSTGEDTYHWALIVGPKNETKGVRGRRYHAKEDLKPDGSIGRLFEEKEIPLTATQMLLVRICVWKIVNDEQVAATLRSVPIRQDVEGWNCVYWVIEAFGKLREEKGAMGTSILAWKDIRDGAMAYVQKKKDEHRFDGRGSFDSSKAATFDLMQGVETIP